MRSGVSRPTRLGQDLWRPRDDSAACRQSAERAPEARVQLTLLPPSARPGARVCFPGPRKVGTHFRRVHELPRLLLSLAAGVGAGHRDSGTEQWSPPSLVGFRRADQTVVSLPHSLRPPGIPVRAHALRLGVESAPERSRDRSYLEIPELGLTGGPAPVFSSSPAPTSV